MARRIPATAELSRTAVSSLQAPQAIHSTDARVFFAIHANYRSAQDGQEISSHE
jgi:hypothetical protein